MHSIFLGFLGDKIGLKPVLIIVIVGMGISGTCINYAPRYNEYQMYPNVIVTSQNIGNENFTLISVQWPIGDLHIKSKREDNQLSICENSAPRQYPSFYENITDYLECRNKDAVSFQVDSLDTSMFQTPWNNSLTILEMPSNTTFCDLYVNYVISAEEEKMICEIKRSPFFGPASTITSGSHTAMFLTYMLLRISQAVFVNTAFSLMDGTAMHLVAEHNGDYAMVQVWTSLAGVLGPLLSGALVEDSSNSFGN